MSGALHRDRIALEPRRLCFGSTLVYREAGGQFELKLYVFAGLDRRTLSVAEVFARPGSDQKFGSMLQRLVDDAAIGFSEALRRGATPHELAGQIGAGYLGAQMKTGGELDDAALQRETHARGACASLEIALPNLIDPLKGENFRRVNVPVSSPAAAMIACCVAVQTWLDALPDETRAALARMTERGLTAEEKGGGK